MDRQQSAQLEQYKAWREPDKKKRWITFRGPLVRVHGLLFCLLWLVVVMVVVWIASMFTGAILVISISGIPLILAFVVSLVATK